MSKKFGGKFLKYLAEMLNINYCNVKKFYILLQSKFSFLAQ